MNTEACSTMQIECVSILCGLKWVRKRSKMEFEMIASNNLHHFETNFRPCSVRVRIIILEGSIFEKILEKTNAS